MPLDAQNRPVVLGIPPQITDLVQTRTWERYFHDALFPMLLFQIDAKPSEWAGNIGDRLAMTRTGLLSVKTTPITVGNDPAVSSYSSEQWDALAAQFGDTIDTNMLTSAVSLANQFIENIQKLGMGGGQSMNHIARNQLYAAYMGGQTLCDTTQAVAAVTFHVQSLAGFLTNINLNAGMAAPQPVSASNGIPVVLHAGAGSAENGVIVGATPDLATNPWGPGNLTLQAVPATKLSSGDAVVALNSSLRTRVGGGYSDDAVSGTDTATLQVFVNLQAVLRQNNVPPHRDGYYHAHISPATEAEIFFDANLQRALTALPDSFYYRNIALGVLAGMVFIRNAEVPNPNTVQAQENFPWETTTTSGVVLQRDIITGAGVIYEKWINEMKLFATEAGTTGRVANFNISNNGVAVAIDRLRLILRAPLDRFQQIVSASWSWTGDFPIPSDLTTGGGVTVNGQTASSRYKRAGIVVHA